MNAFLNEDSVEQLVLDIFASMGYQTAYGPDIGPNGDRPERENYGQVLLFDRLRQALQRINNTLPVEAIDKVIDRLTAGEGGTLIEENQRFHRLLTDGVEVELPGEDGGTRHEKVYLFDFDDADCNDWLVVNQLTVAHSTTGKVNTDRRPDVIVYVNGMPLAVVELKNPADVQAKLQKAYHQLETYKLELSDLFLTNEVLVVSDGQEAKLGTISAGWDRFQPWRTTDGETLAGLDEPQLDVLLRGAFDRSRFLDIVRSFVVFDDGDALIKKLAGYHQYHAVRKAVQRTLEAVGPEHDRKIGVVWHTQGSGKSLSMLFYAGQLIQLPELANPTVVVITDRNDLDNQLYGTFCTCKDLIRQDPEQVEDRADLHKRLARASGGVIFTTLQKFLPEKKGQRHDPLSDRHNIIVIADEAHRSQYGFAAKIVQSKDGTGGDWQYGLAQHMRDALPHASFVGFTGTPIETTDKVTTNVFGNYIDIYDIQQAVEDGATVPIYYENRLAKIELSEKERPRLDKEFEEMTEEEADSDKRRLATKWTALESLVGSDKRLGLIAEDIVDHYEKRKAALPGKAMIVCMSRRICVELYQAIVNLRPDWHDDALDQGAIKVIITGSASDGPSFQQHIHKKGELNTIARRFKDPADPLSLVIVCDMWLTGFDAPCVHTMYLDKPLKAHGLVQAIARVNRVFGAKPSGLVVDYLGLASELKEATVNYTRSGGKGKPAFDQAQAVVVLQEKLEIIRAMFHGFDYTSILTGTPGERLVGVRKGANFYLDNNRGDEGKSRFLQAANDLYRAYALATPAEEALAVREEVGFFQAVRTFMVKTLPNESDKKHRPADLDAAISQLVSRSLVSDDVVDVFELAGMERPDVSMLSKEFLAEFLHMQQKSVAAELLERLLREEIRNSSKRNLVMSKKFSEMLEEAINKYQNRSIEAAQVVLEMLKLAEEVREANQRGESLNLSEEEVAFYDALADNESAEDVLGTPTLCELARELVKSIRNSVTIDWERKDSVRAEIRARVRRLLRKYKYPPDQQAAAIELVLKQTELMCKDWAVA